jgi:hypothetical protein
MWKMISRSLSNAFSFVTVVPLPPKEVKHNLKYLDVPQKWGLALLALILLPSPFP